MSSTAQFRNFYLVVTAREGQYFAHVADSPAGESSDPCPFTVPFADQEIQHILLRLENAILRSARAVRGSSVEEDLKAIGEQLFQSLLVKPASIQRLYENSRQRLGRADRLRVKLRIEPPLLATLPWEYFYDSLVVNDYLGLHAQTSLIRYMQVQRPVEKLEVQGPLRILGMVASPANQNDARYLDATDERERIDKSLQSLHARGSIDFKWVPGESKSDLFDALTQGEWHVFHFIGHGGTVEENGFLEMGAEGGKPHRVFGKDLTRLFNMQPTLRLVVLNCCDSAHGQASLARELVSSGIPAVLAMQFPISDDAAIELAGAFYDALAKGEPVDGAVTRARLRIQMNPLTKFEWGIPVLFMQAPDGQIFERAVLSGPESPAAKVLGVATARPAPSVPVRVDAPTTPVTMVATPNSNDGFFDSLMAGLGREESPRYAEFMRPVNLEALNTKQLSALVDLGTSLLSAGGADEIRPRLGQLHHRLGMRYQAESSLSQAFVNFSTAIELDPKQPEFLFSRANVFARTQRYDAAGADLDAAIKLDPQRGDLHWAKGVIYLFASRTPGGVDRINAAIQAFDAAIACDPRVAKYFSSRGAAHTRLGDLRSALSDLDSALGLDPLDAATYYNRSHLRRREGDEPGAEQDLRRAAELGSAEAAAELRKGLSGGVTWQ